MSEQTKSDFVSYELSSELRDIGFDDICLAYYNCERDFIFVQGKTKFLTCEIPIPTFSQVFRWFRENYLIFGTINVDQTMEPKFCYSITRYEPMQFLEHWDTVVYNSDLFYTYEEAEVECIKELIKVVK